jgi:hypothetical protein
MHKAVEFCAYLLQIFSEIMRVWCLELYFLNPEEHHSLVIPPGFIISFVNTYHLFLWDCCHSWLLEVSAKEVLSFVASKWNEGSLAGVLHSKMSAAF